MRSIWKSFFWGDKIQLEKGQENMRFSLTNLQLNLVECNYFSKIESLLFVPNVEFNSHC